MDTFKVGDRVTVGGAGEHHAPSRIGKIGTVVELGPNEWQVRVLWDETPVTPQPKTYPISHLQRVQ